MMSWLKHPRCFLDEPEFTPGQIDLSTEEGRHLNRVRRVGQGSPVRVLNGRGQVGLALLQKIDRDKITLELQKVITVEELCPRLTLVIGSLKQSAWDEVLKHAVELGVNRIIRVQTERSVAEIQAAKENRKRKRWRECMIEAIKQSGNPWLPELILCAGVDAVFGVLEPGCVQLLAGMEDDPRAVSEVVASNRPSPIALWIGPEGDFTPAERESILGQGAELIHLGGRVLRAETAALSLLSYLRLCR